MKGVLQDVLQYDKDLEVIDCLSEDLLQNDNMINRQFDMKGWMGREYFTNFPEMVQVRAFSYEMSRDD